MPYAGTASLQAGTPAARSIGPDPPTRTRALPRQHNRVLPPRYHGQLRHRTSLPGTIQPRAKGWDTPTQVGHHTVDTLYRRSVGSRYTERKDVPEPPSNITDGARVGPPSRLAPPPLLFSRGSGCGREARPSHMVIASSKPCRAAHPRRLFRCARNAPPRRPPSPPGSRRSRAAWRAPASPWSPRRAAAGRSPRAAPAAASRRSRGGRRGGR